MFLRLWVCLGMPYVDLSHSSVYKRIVQSSVFLCTYSVSSDMKFNTQINNNLKLRKIWKVFNHLTTYACGYKITLLEQKVLNMAYNMAPLLNITHT